MKEWLCEEVPAVTVDGKVISTMLHQLRGIVRCRDCKWHTMIGEMLLCTAQDKPHTYDWFCADGEPKDKQLAHADNDTAQYADAPTMMSAT